MKLEVSLLGGKCVTQPSGISYEDGGQSSNRRTDVGCSVDELFFRDSSKESTIRYLRYVLYRYPRHFEGHSLGYRSTT